MWFKNRRAKFRQQKRQREILQQTAARRASLTMGLLSDPSFSQHHPQGHRENAPGSTETNTSTTSPSARSSSSNCVDQTALLDPSALLIKTETNDTMPKGETNSTFFLSDPMATHWFSPNNPASTSKNSILLIA